MFLFLSYTGQEDGWTIMLGNEFMAIDVVPDEVIWTVNWLHYLNYEPIARTSGTCYFVRTRNDLGQTVTSYGWCNSIPRVVPLFILVSERFASEPLSYQMYESLPRVDLFFSAFGERLRVWPSFYGQASTFRSCPTYYVTVLVFMCMYVCAALAQPFRTVRLYLIATVWTGVTATIWIGVSTALAHLCIIFWSTLSRAFSIYKYVTKKSYGNVK